MTSLVEVPTGRHLAQFHRDVESLTESAFVFLEAGLRGGNSVLVVAPTDRVEPLFDRLAASRLHPQSLSDSGQLAVLDETAIVPQFVRGATPAWTGLRASLGPVLSRLRASGRGTRIYTEIANAMWEAGNTDAAIGLEDFWNALAQSYQFSLYCGYCMDTHNDQCYAGPLEELGRTHSDILGTPDDERFGVALDRASKEIFGIPLTQMAGVTRQDGARRFPSGQRTMLWVTRNLPMSMPQLVERARYYFKDNHP